MYKLRLQNLIIGRSAFRTLVNFAVFVPWDGEKRHLAVLNAHKNTRGTKKTLKKQKNADALGSRCVPMAFAVIL
jgi:hypothetical protein